MESNEKITLGDFFKSVRREKGVTVDEVVRETNISKRYLQALEENDFASFPGETYILGFISTYAEALEIDKNQALSVYRRQMRIEQDAPLEQLVGTKKKKAPKTVDQGRLGVIVGLAVFLIIFIIVLATRGGRGGGGSETYTFTTNEIADIADQIFQVGDTIVVQKDGSKIKIELVEINASQNLKIKINRQIYYVKEGELLNVDTDDNEIDDLGFEIFNIEETALMVSLAMLEEAERGPQVVSTFTEDFQDVVVAETDIATLDSIEDAELEITGTGSGWLAYRVDDGDEVQATVYDGYSVTLSFEDILVLMLGNASAVNISIDGKQEDGGGLGEVNKSVFYWKKINDKYTLVRAVLEPS